MKKYFILVIVLYFLIAAIMFLFVKDKPASITILSKKSNYSRILTDQSERLDIPLYLSVEQSFLTDCDNIDLVTLYDEHNEIKLNMNEITNTMEQYPYHGKLYYLFIFSFTCIDIDLNDIELTFSDAILSLTYKNDVNYDFEIGNVNLIFKEIQNEAYMDLTRLYGIVNNNGSENYLAGIVLGLSRNDEEKVEIEDIDIGIENVYLDTDEAVSLSKAIDINQDINEILNKEYQSCSNNFSQSKTLRLSGSQLFFIPIKYIGDFQNINRFPLLISYTFDGMDYLYVVDDFLFYTTRYDLGEGNETITEYLYQY